MTRGTLQTLKATFSFGSGTKVSKADPGSPFFNASEIASLRRQLSTSSAEAVAVAKKNGAKAHARVAAIKAKAKAK
jgi:hypothetical protein